MGALFSGATTYYFHTAFTLGRRTGRLLLAMAMPATANLLLCLLLIPRFGVQGAAWATAGGFAIGLAASAALGRGVIALPVPWTTLGRCGLAAALMTAVVLRLPPPGGVAEVALKTAAGALTYGLAVLALDAAGLRRELLARLQPRREHAA